MVNRHDGSEETEEDMSHEVSNAYLCKRCVYLYATGVLMHDDVTKSAIMI